jgi:hypothetical protein
MGDAVQVNKLVYLPFMLVKGTGDGAHVLGIEGLAATATVVVRQVAKDNGAVTTLAHGAIIEVGDGNYLAPVTTTALGTWMLHGEDAQADPVDDDGLIVNYDPYGGATGTAPVGTDWTYSGDPASSALDALRFAIGDTTATSPLLTNSELNYVIAQNSKQNNRVATCFESIGRKLLQQPNFALERWSEQRHQVAQSFIAQAKELRRTATQAGGLYAGGISRADKAARDADPDRDKPFAQMDMDQNPEAGDMDPLVSSE